MASALQFSLAGCRPTAALQAPAVRCTSSLRPALQVKGLPAMQRKCSIKRSTASPSVVVKAGGNVDKGRLIVEPSYAIPSVLLTAAGLLFGADQAIVAAPVGLLGALLLFQTTRVRFLFDEDSLEVVIGEKAEKSGENAFVGGENRWRYSTFTNWEFWWPNFPVLVYFKETQTKPEGQIHFFPVIADGRKLYNAMVERCGPSQNSSPSKE